MKKTILLLTINLMLLVSVFAQPKRLNLNDDTVLPITLKSTEVVSSFDVAIKKSRPFALNPMVRNYSNVAIGDTLQLALFPGKEYLSVIQTKTTDVNGITVLVSRLTGFKFAFCLISISEQAVLVTVDIPELKEKYSTRFLPENRSQYMVQLDEWKLDQLEDGHLSISTIDSIQQSYLPNGISRLAKENYIQTNTGLKSTPLSQGVDDSAQIDILVIYTPAAKEWAETYEGGINNTISLAMANCNLVSQNSNLGIKFNMVHSTEVDYNETKDSYLDIDNLTNGFIPNVNAIKDIVAADLVVLFSEMNDVGGLAWLLDNRDGKEEFGYSIVRIQQASGLSTIHEIGHNHGANHPKQQYNEPGPTIWSNWPENTWSAGWRWKSDDNNYYCDVMTYEPGFYFPDGITHSMVPYFSDPDILFQGQPTGDPVDGNNARTIREMKHVLAAYRETQHQNTPTVYTLKVNNITNESAVSGGVITKEGVAPVTARGIVWSINQMPTLSDNFTVDGSGTGYFISQLTSLEISTTYYIRAYATNSVGTSYGNQVALTYTGGVQSDFITRWELPSGQDKLGFFIARNGNVSFKWETIPSGQSGSGIFPSGIGLVEINDLPEGQIIRVHLAPDNLSRFYNYYMICPYPAILGPDRRNLVDVEQWGSAHWTSMRDAFYGCNRLNISANDKPDLQDVSDISEMFFYCTILNGPNNLRDWDVSSVTQMNYTFGYTGNFNQVIDTWNVANVKSTIGLFNNAKAFNQPIGNWNVSNVESMISLFYCAEAFNQPIGNWDVSKVKDMAIMFSNASAFNQDIGKWDISNVEDISSMFHGAQAFNQNIGGWDVSNIPYMEHLFHEAYNFNQDLSGWDVSNVIYMKDMFHYASSFNQPIGNWNVAKVIDMENMFDHATAFNQNLGDWNLSGSPNMSFMLNYCGMDCNNYSETLIGWNANPNTPNNLNPTAYWLFYNQVAIEARTNLIENKGWSLYGDFEVTELLHPGPISGKTSICGGKESVVYTVPEVDFATSYVWKLPNSVIEINSSNTITVDFDSSLVSGDITVKAINVCVESLESSLYISVNPFSGAAGEISGPSLVDQEKDSAIYTVPPISNATTYLWTLPYGVIGSSTTNTISVNFGNKAISGIISVKGLNGQCEGQESRLNITVNETAVTTYQTELWGMTSKGGAYDMGVLFKYNPTTSTYTKVLDFNELTGSNPCGSLLEASNGKIYGMTEKGGIFNSGVLFEYEPATLTYTKKVDFSWNINGSNPKGSLIEASNGKFYGMTLSGGSNWDGVLFEYDPATSTITKKVDFNDTINGRCPYGSLIEAAKGKLYGMTSGGGVSNGTIFEYDIATSTCTKKLDFEESITGFRPNGSLILASNGKLYGMASYGSVNYGGTLFEYDPATSSFTKKHDFNIALEGQRPMGSLIEATNENLYGMTLSGGVNAIGVIFEYDPTTSTYIKKFDFTETSNGKYPRGTLLEATNGKLYGMTIEGGVNDLGVIFEYDPASSTYSKKLDFNGVNGSKPDYTQLIEVCKQPQITKTIPDVAVCEGEDVTICTAASGNGLSYQWQVNKGSGFIHLTDNSIYSGATNYTLQIKNAISGMNGLQYRCVVTSTCPKKSIESDTAMLTVNSIPSTPIITLNNNILHSDAPEGNQWYIQNGEIANAINKEYAPKVNGEYHVMVSRLGCKSEPSNTISVTVTGVEKIASENTLKVYPNPVSNELTIEFEGNSEKIGFEIFNSIGQTVYRGNMVNQTTVGTSSFAPGTYLVKIENGGAFEFSKIIKK